MKKAFILLVIISFFSSHTYAQLNTGSYFISGTTNLKLDLSSTKNVSTDGDKEKHTSFGFTPKAGYFLKNRIAVGGLFNYDYFATNYEGPNDDSKESEGEWYIGPLGRYYFEYGKIIPFAEISVAFGGTKGVLTTAGAENKITHSLFRTAAGAGANYFMNDHIAFEGIIDWFYMKLKPTTEGATGEGHPEMGVSFKIGVVVYFGKI